MELLGWLKTPLIKALSNVQLTRLFSWCSYTKSLECLSKFTKSMLKEPALEKKKLRHVFGFLYFRVLTTLSELDLELCYV